ncbi:hypothetical protein E1182_26750 [Micromonospora sp. KC721]|nr:hypothetical protein E1182_26750 [Micromonospora sp. KC721]
MRIPWYRCPITVLPVLPRREPGTHLPEWLRQPTRPRPAPAPDLPGRLTLARQWWTGRRSG